MSEVRRIRFVPHFKVEDTNPYIPESERPRMVWRDWVEIGVYEHARLMQIDHGGRPPKGFMLRIPMRDPETGEMTDADGDQALLRITMCGADITYHGGIISVKGFVAKSELAHEEAYIAGKIGESTYHLDCEYVCEEWHFHA